MLLVPTLLQTGYIKILLNRISFSWTIPLLLTQMTKIYLSSKYSCFYVFPHRTFPCPTFWFLVSD